MLKIVNTHYLSLQYVILILFNKVLSSISIFWVQKKYL
jgi:hypothetical protein